MARNSVPPPAINPHLANLAPYPPGKPIEEVQREYGLESVIKLASNENPNGPSPRALKAMAAVAGEMHLYPDGSGFYLKAALAARLGVAPAELILGNGSDEIVVFLALAYLRPGLELITSDHAFVRYRMAAELAGAQTRLVPMKDMRHDLKAIAAAVGPATAMICLDVPCNPTGTIVARRDLTTFLKKIPPRVIVVLDQAYHEFAAGDPGYVDGFALRAAFPNLVVTRTFSKAYGLAGLRIGYAAARPEIVNDLDRIRPPFNTSRLAQAAALAALDDAAHVRRTVQANARGLAQLEKGLRALGCATWPSRANFILTDLHRNGNEVFQTLLERGVVTRPMGGYGLSSCLRISVGAPAENRRCLAALKEVLSAQPTAN
ncbi:MAG: histidinol-phosphate transaminase [bacterium]|nr:histidinol-phosphate transaminase [bacterium]